MMRKVLFFSLVGIVFSETNVEEPTEMVEMEEEKSLNSDYVYATPMYGDTYRKYMKYAAPQPGYDSYRNDYKYPTMAYGDSYRNDLKYATPTYGDSYKNDLKYAAPVYGDSYRNDLKYEAPAVVYDSYRNDLKYSSPVYGDKYGQDYKRDYADYDLNPGYSTYDASPYGINYGVDKYDRYDPYTKTYNTYSVAY
ncbi:uncharacterized protein LOC136039554 [Artemia franciscana]|uniref:Uncharacterized protein n=2 Tax=Artemia franciscana TaxID=6661 RepID=A0AA88L1D6_ARTSF|nr:hypothetical protein QYM36_010086 [Artemia franciscana]